jgi:ATP adenylyltransferase
MDALITSKKIQSPINLEKCALLQTISRELGSEKSPRECDALIAEAQELDRIADQIKGSQHRPMQAPWRDAYKKEIATPFIPQQLPITTSPSQQRVPSTSVPIVGPQKERPCPFCDQFSRPNDDKKNYILERRKHTVVMFNRSPYGPLHFLILPYKHLAKMSDLSEETRQEIFKNAQRWLKKLNTIGVDNAQFFFNLDDKCAGASLPGHLHGQLLSRWQGDESALNSRLAEDLVKAERCQDSLLPCFYDIADKTILNESSSNKSSSNKSSSNELSQTPSELTAYQQSLNKLVRVYEPYKKLLLSLQPPVKKKISEPCYACTLKNYENEEADCKHLVVKRFAHWFLLLNRFGYIGGDSFLVTRAHGKSFARLNQEELIELTQILSLTQENLKKLVTAPGYNIGCSVGDCTDKPFQEHVCFNIIPRTNIDTAAITTCFGFTVIDKNIPSLYERLAATFKDNLALQVPTIYPNQPVATSSLTNHVTE